MIVSDSRTHILVCLVDSSIFGTNKYTEDIAKSYDETVEGEFTQNGEIIRMSSTSIASVSGNDLTITNTNSNLTAGKYVITLSRSTFSTEHQYTTNRFYLPVHTAVVDGTTNTITFENIFYNMIDKEAYLNFGNTLPEGEWNSIENSEYSWIKDDTTKSYILDTKCEYMVKNTDKMMFSIAVFNNENELIETIVLNGLSLES